MKNFTKLSKLPVILFGATILMSGLSACSSEDVLENAEETTKYAAREEVGSFETIFKNEKEIAMRDFSIALVKSLNQSNQLRQILKNEALEAINLDPEVLVYKVKNLETETGTVESLLNSNLNGRSLADIFEIMPTITVLVPELPEEEFNAGNWDVNSQVPAVAVRLFTANDTPIILNDYSQHVISQEIIPAFPVLVVKDNERIISNRHSNFAGIEDDPFFMGESFSFKFISPYFSKWFVRPIFRNDQKLVDAYNHYKTVDGWQRDYIYYGIKPTTPNGPFVSDYRESIVAMTTGQPMQLYGKISDQTGDPSFHLIQRGNGSHWKDGNYEFNFRLTSNSKAGAGESQSFKFPVKATDLFELSYQRMTGLLGAFGYFIVNNVEAKTYSPNVSTIPWNLEETAVEFKMTIFEEDSTEESTVSTTMNSEFATNFGIDLDLGLSEMVKLGLKFGTSAKDTRSNTVAVKKTLLSDDLGDYIMYFRDKVILSETPTSFGNFYSKRWYGEDTRFLKFQYYPKRVQ